MLPTHRHSAMERVCRKEDRLGEVMTKDSRFFTQGKHLRSIDTNSSSSSSGCRGGAGGVGGGAGTFGDSAVV